MKNIKKLIKIIFLDFDDSFNKFYKKINNKKILITGGTGLIGQYFLVFFYFSIIRKKPPKKVTVIINKSFPKYLLFLKKNKIFLFKKMKLGYDTLGTEKFDIIIHAAGYGQPAKFMKNSIDTILINTAATLDMIKKIKKNGKFLYLSTSEIYSGNNKNFINENETGSTTPSHKRAAYIEAKRIGETIVNIYRNKHKINAKSARICLAYGPGTKEKDDRIINILVERAIKRNKVFIHDQGKEIRSYLYIKDAIIILLNILLYGKKEVYNVAGEEKISIKKLGQLIAKLNNKKFEIQDKKINYKIGSPKKTSISVKRVKDEFNFKKFTKINDGLKKTIEWQKKLYKTKSL